ncbi:MAG: hypothetical protein R2706_18255 [Acidimicrobiales bacterium]
MHRLNPTPPADKMDAVVSAEFAWSGLMLQEARAEVEMDPVASELEHELHISFARRAVSTRCGVA